MRNDLFVISSENLEQIQSHLYGYMVADDGELVFDRVPAHPSHTGAFVLVEREPERIMIRQDFCAAFGLYLWREPGGQRFMLSNSFFLLAEQLRGQLTLNEDHALAYSFAFQSPLTAGDTLANEIVRLPSSGFVLIDIPNRTAHAGNVAYPYYTRNLAAPGSLRRLDEWYEKWVRTVRNAAEQGLPLYADLSGGLDTRINLSLLRNARLEQGRNVRMLTHKQARISKDVADLRIAEQIAGELGFELGNSDALFEPQVPSDSTTEPLESIRLLSFGSTVMAKYQWAEQASPVVWLKGVGSTIKGGFWKNPKAALAVFQNVIDKAAPTDAIRERVRSYNARVVRTLLSDYHHPLASHRATYLYKKASIELRDMKKVTSWLSQNLFALSPFMDPVIAEFDYDPLNYDVLGLCARILDRYDARLLDFPVENRRFMPGTIPAARAMNAARPWQALSFEPLAGMPDEVPSHGPTSLELAREAQHIWTREDFVPRVGRIVGEDYAARVVAEVDLEHINVGIQPINALLALYEFSQLVEG